MSETGSSDTPSSPKGSRLWRWAKRFMLVILVLSGICVVSFSVLANIGGSSDEIKGSLERFISDLTGYEASIGALNSVNLFPVIIFDFAALELSEKQSADAPKDAERGPVIVAVQEVYIARSFWDFAFHSRAFNAVMVKNLVANAGTLADKRVHLESLEIVHAADKSAFLEGRGMIGDERYTLSLALETRGKPPGQTYRIVQGQDLVLIRQDGARFSASFENGKISLKPL